MSQKPSAHNTRIAGIYGCSSPKKQYFGFWPSPKRRKKSVKRELKVKQEHVFFEFLKGTSHVRPSCCDLYKMDETSLSSVQKPQSFHCLPWSSIILVEQQEIPMDHDTVRYSYSPMDWIAELHFMIIITISQHMHTITHSNSQESSGNWVGPSSRILVILGKGFVLWKSPKIEISRPLKW